MIIGLPKEIKKNEYRVAATPAAVAALIRKGNSVLFEHDCGLGSGFPDTEYLAAGAEMVSHEDVYRKCDMLYKVKEIEPAEYDLLHEGQIVFTYCLVPFCFCLMMRLPVLLPVLYFLLMVDSLPIAGCNDARYLSNCRTGRRAERRDDPRGLASVSLRQKAEPCADFAAGLYEIPFQRRIYH